MAEESKALAHVEVPGSLVNFIAQAVRDPTIDVAKLRALLDVQRELIGDDARDQFNRDFIALQQSLPRIKKDGTLSYPVDKNKPDGPQRKISSYSKWETIDAAIRPILHQHGFALSFSTQPRQGDGGGLTVIAILRHRAGHSTETPFPVPLDTSGGKNNLQGYGSAESYGQRYSAKAALNLIFEGEDDDGKMAGMKFITAEQAAELQKLIEDTNTDDARFCQMFGVAHLGTLEAGAYAGARNMLILKKQKPKTEPKVAP
jgi:hypothetical protein